jgi:hypothetical protein
MKSEMEAKVLLDVYSFYHQDDYHKVCICISEPLEFLNHSVSLDFYIHDTSATTYFKKKTKGNINAPDDNNPFWASVYVPRGPDGTPWTSLWLSPRDAKGESNSRDPWAKGAVDTNGLSNPN